MKGLARRAKRDQSDEIGVKRVNVSINLSPIVVLITAFYQMIYTHTII